MVSAQRELLRLELTRALLSGRSALVAAGRGLGRSRLLNDVGSGLETEGRTVHVIQGCDGDSSVPLVPWAPVLSSKNLNPSQPLTAYTHLPVRLAADNDLILVDDADRLDHASAVLLSQITRAGVACVVTASALDTLPTTVRDALARRGWQEYKLEPLNREQVIELASSLLPGTLTPPAAAKLAQHARGNPAVVVDLVRLAAANGHIRSLPYGLEIIKYETSPRIREIVAIDLAGLSHPATELTELLAVAGRLPVSGCQEEALDELITRGLAVIDSGNLVTLPDPLLDDVVLAGLDEMTTRKRRLTATSALTKHGDLQDQSALLRVRAHLPVPANSLISAATKANSRGHFQEAIELTDAFLRNHADLESSFGALAIRAHALSAEGELERAEEDLTYALELAVSDDNLVQIGQLLGLHYAVRRTNPHQAVIRVADVASRITGEGHRQVLEGDLIKWRMMAGAAPQISMTPLPPLADSNPVQQAVIGAMMATMGGSLVTAREIISNGLSALTKTQEAPAFAEDLLRLSQFLSLAFDNEVAAASRYASAYLETALRDVEHGVGMWEYALGELALHTGRFTLSTKYADRAATHLVWRDFTGLQPSATALLAASLSRSGNLKRAQHLVSRLTAEHTADVKVALHVARVKAETHLANRDLGAAVHELVTTADLAIDQQHLYLGVLLLDEAFMLAPNNELAERLDRLRYHSRLTELLGRRALVLIEGDPRAMLLIGQELATAQFDGRALHTVNLAARTFRQSGAEAASRRARLLASQLAATPNLGLWPQDRDLKQLSVRELEIAIQAANRVRSKEIADQLSVSTRTVDNHLRNIYRKLGVSGRDGIAEALALVDDLDNCDS